MDSNRPVRLITSSPLILAGQFISRTTRKGAAAAAEDSYNECGRSPVARQTSQSAAAFNVVLKRSSATATAQRRPTGNFAS